MLVVPGEAIDTEPGFLRGHGTYLSSSSSSLDDGNGGERLVSSVCGRVTRVNKLISVLPNKRRYTGEVGDLVVGRVAAVEAKRWKVNIQSSKDAVLQLSSVNLPDGSQRIRTHEDALQMRSIFQEGDLVSAEIQNINSEGGVALHTRSMKYGKLVNGQVLQVSSSLIPRLPQHYISLSCGVDVLLGVNGCIWITRSMPKEWLLTEGVLEKEAESMIPEVETLTRLHTLHASTPISRDIRVRICRVKNAIHVLEKCLLGITPERISSIVAQSESLQIPPADMLLAPHLETLSNSLFST